ncbi:MAG: FkbM family methyltransferase, partial [Flavobacteriales bacterium]|nr:FkbM family methyltransferase [Flavobacteriales bacterium]
EIDDLKYFSQLATKARVILDIGANTGLYSILSSKSNPRSQIYAFEPYQTNSRRLSRNLELNTCNNVEIVNDALGEDVRKIEFAVPVDGEICDISSADTDFSRRFYKKWRDYENIKVSQNTVDDFVKNNGIQSVDLIKIDVENYEIPVLKGAQQTLREHGPALLVEIFVDKEKDDYFKDYLVPLGYSCYSISKSGLRSHPSIPADQTSRNFLFMKNLSF